MATLKAFDGLATLKLVITESLGIVRSRKKVCDFTSHGYCVMLSRSLVTEWQDRITFSTMVLFNFKLYLKGRPNQSNVLTCYSYNDFSIVCTKCFDPATSINPAIPLYFFVVSVTEWRNGMTLSNQFQKTVLLAVFTIFLVMLLIFYINTRTYHTS